MTSHKPGYWQDSAGGWWYTPPNGKRRYGAIRTICESCGETRVAIRSQARPKCHRCNQYADLPVGTKYTTRAGYVMVRVANDDPLIDELGYNGRPWILEHRYVMRKAVGRTFKRGEIVHHINGDRADNRLENLQLLKRREHDQGQRAHCPRCGYHGMAFAGQNGGGLV